MAVRTALGAARSYDHEGQGGVELGNVNVIRCFSRFAGGGLKNHRSYGSFKSPIVGVGEREPEFGILMLDFGHFFAFFFKLAGFGDALHFKNRFVEFFISAHTAVSIHAFAKVSLVVQIITVGITVEDLTVVGLKKVSDFFVHLHSAQRFEFPAVVFIFASKVIGHILGSASI